jgi:hypothetical protein
MCVCEICRRQDGDSVFPLSMVRFRACRSARPLVGSPKVIRQEIDASVMARSRGAEVVDGGRFCDTPRISQGVRGAQDLEWLVERCAGKQE